MSNLDNNEQDLKRFVKAMTKAFPDADIDEHEDDVTCSYGDIGLCARSEEGSLVIEVK